MAGDEDILTGNELDEKVAPAPKDEAVLDTEEQEEETVLAEDEGEAEEEQIVEEVKPRSRAADRIANLAAERARADAKAAQLQQQLEEVLKAQRDTASRQTQDDEQRRLAEMDPNDRVAYLANKQAEALQSQIAQLQFQLHDGQDRAAFQARALNDKLFAKYADKVEAKLTELRGQGANASRGDILKYFLGDALLEQRAKSGGSKERASGRMTSAQGKPVSAKGDVSGGARGGKTVEQRLENVLI